MPASRLLPLFRWPNSNAARAALGLDEPLSTTGLFKMADAGATLPREWDAGNAEIDTVATAAREAAEPYERKLAEYRSLDRNLTKQELAHYRQLEKDSETAWNEAIRAQGYSKIVRDPFDNVKTPQQLLRYAKEQLSGAESNTERSESRSVLLSEPDPQILPDHPSEREIVRRKAEELKNDNPGLPAIPDRLEDAADDMEGLIDWCIEAEAHEPPCPRIRDLSICIRRSLRLAAETARVTEKTVAENLETIQEFPGDTPYSPRREARAIAQELRQEYGDLPRLPRAHSQDPEADLRSLLEWAERAEAEQREEEHESEVARTDRAPGETHDAAGLDESEGKEAESQPAASTEERNVLRVMASDPHRRWAVTGKDGIHTAMQREQWKDFRVSEKAIRETILPKLAERGLVESSGKRYVITEDGQAASKDPQMKNNPSQIEGRDASPSRRQPARRRSAG